MRELEKSLKALANRRRLTILALLKKRGGDIKVGDIAKEINLSFKSTSRHLAVLFIADILQKEQKSLEMYYRLAENQKPATRRILDLL